MGLGCALCACQGPSRDLDTTPSAAVRATAAPAPGGGLWVCFVRLEGSHLGARARLEATEGRIERVLYGPERLSVAVLWRDPGGILECRFPYGASGRFDAATPPDAGAVRYRLFRHEGLTVEAEVPRGCPLVDSLRLEVSGRPPGKGPVELRIPGRDPVVLGSLPARVDLELPRDEEGTLRSVDVPLRLRVGEVDLLFWVGVDRDGAPAALSGTVLRW